MDTYGHWNITLVGEFDPSEWFGFIYLIEDTQTTKAYIGKKQFRFKKTKQEKGKKRKIQVDSDWQTYCSSSIPLQDDIREFGKERFTFIILQLCSGKAELSFLEEQYQYGAKVITARLPTGEHKYYNRTIAHRHFAGVEKQSAESKEKTSESLRRYHENHPGANIRTEESRQRIADSLRIYFETHKPTGWWESASAEERSERARHAQSFRTVESLKEAGRRAGQLHRERGTGICGMSAEEKEKACTNGGKSAGKLPWWNNGIKSTRSHVCPGEGWTAGRISWKWGKSTT